MLRKFRVLILFALATLAWNVTPAYSTTLTTYSDLASFNAATSGDTTINFTGLAPNTTTDYSTFQGLNADSNVQFIGIAGPGYSLQVFDTSQSQYPWDNFGTGEALQQVATPFGGPYYIHVKFSMPVTAFGTNLFTSNPYAMPFAITLYGVSGVLAPSITQTVTEPFPTPAFWGVTSDMPIYSADFTLQGPPSSGGTTAFLDNFTYGTAQAQAPPDVPEAATMLLIGSGLLGLAILGKKMRPVQPV